MNLDEIPPPGETPMEPTPLSYEEMLAILHAAYPGRFEDQSRVERVTALLGFIDSVRGFEDIADLLGRVVMLTMPMTDPETFQTMHCVGRLSVTRGRTRMDPAVRREVRE